jgi:6,7-dimethyl-8-ribityllumazine synthase
MRTAAAQESQRTLPDARGRRFAVVVAEFHRDVAERLLAGAQEVLAAAGAAPEDVVVARVPGAFEVPPTARRMAAAGFDAVICLGAVIRGETAHFDYVCRAVTDGLARLAYEADVPVTFGILTTFTPEQALARADKGAEAARAALHVLALWEELGLKGRRGAGGA